MKKIGSQSVRFDNPITILETASIVGPKEAEGPMAKYFDKCLEDEFWGEKTWEKAESKIIKETVNFSIIKSIICVIVKFMHKFDKKIVICVSKLFSEKLKY